MRKIGFIGIGVMGESMARNIMKKGFDVSVYTRTKSKADKIVSEGAKWCDSVKECSADADAIITIVGYPKDVEEVYLGENGIISSAKKGAYVIDMTTTSPRLSEKIFKVAAENGIKALDAPVSGGDVGAKNGTLAIMVGGLKEDFDACLPLFEAMGTNIKYEGPAGSGQHVKMANQIAIAGAVCGVAEAIGYASAMGVDIDTMLNTISSGAAGSWQLSNNGPKMSSGDYAPGFFIKHFIKDMKIACDEAEDKGIELSVLKDVCSKYISLEEKGMGNLGTQAIIEYYKK
ncbi:MAG: NAD(P)-dependent oxidoreductase [Firmicutes bacterium]|nr:NAD(P)-dependent oxidoreductase [Bacillota bacterium]